MFLTSNLVTSILLTRLHPSIHPSIHPFITMTTFRFQWLYSLLSGGHINPAVTLTMAILGKLSWIKVPVYFLAQYLGAFLGAASVYGVYYGRSLLWRHNGRDSFSNHQPHACLLDRSWMQTQIKENIKAPRHWPFVRGIHWWPVNSPHKVTRKLFPFDDVIMWDS